MANKTINNKQYTYSCTWDEKLFYTWNWNYFSSFSALIWFTLNDFVAVLPLLRIINSYKVTIHMLKMKWYFTPEFGAIFLFNAG